MDRELSAQDTGDALSAEGIARFLRHRELRLRVYPTIGSTNTALKAMAAEGAEAGLALVAAEQTAGRGRMGRSFYSPAGTGLYMSLLLRPKCTAAECALLTGAAAVAAAESVEALTGRKTAIKWVNDVLLDGRKICGILTETALDPGSGRPDWAVVGVGVNVRPPEGGFPEDIRDRAGAVFSRGETGELRCALAAALLDRLTELYGDLGGEECYNFYVNRSSVLGRDVWLLSPGRAPEAATVLSIGRDYALEVRLADGTMRRVAAGEISLRDR